MTSSLPTRRVALVRRCDRRPRAWPPQIAAMQGDQRKDKKGSRMWTRIQTVVDGKPVSGDWTICRNEVPVGRICHDPKQPGVAAWAWSVLHDPNANGRAWTEEAALSAIKDGAEKPGNAAA
ncbi:hypothetical protein O4J55_16110 [Paracoccus sp. PXZ]|uniref:hypothetical protein n=1 Tax=Paracoccus sp. MKU1 TaxID=1745182 RepID=UPI001EF02FC2|nr:hypothetical protein [Paracoccus sp. MKU1]